jgi:hypothetical protein
MARQFFPHHALDASQIHSKVLSRSLVPHPFELALSKGAVPFSALRQTPMQVDAFLGEHGVELEYSLEDLERDRETHRQLGL